MLVFHYLYSKQTIILTFIEISASYPNYGSGEVTLLDWIFHFAEDADDCIGMNARKSFAEILYF